MVHHALGSGCHRERAEVSTSCPEPRGLVRQLLQVDLSPPTDLWLVCAAGNMSARPDAVADEVVFWSKWWKAPWVMCWPSQDVTDTLTSSSWVSDEKRREWWCWPSQDMSDTLTSHPLRPWGESELSAIHRPDTGRQWRPAVHPCLDAADQGAGDEGGTWIRIHKRGRKREEVSTTNLLQFALNVWDAPLANASGLSIQSSEPGNISTSRNLRRALCPRSFPGPHSEPLTPWPEAAPPVCLPFLSPCRMRRPSFFPHPGILSGLVSMLFSSKGALFFKRPPPPFLI